LREPFLFLPALKWLEHILTGFEVVGTYSQIPAPLICDISGLFVLNDPEAGVFY
jgi:hypothetical protein